MTEETLVTRRPKRSTAGNRMQAALAEMSVEELTHDAEEDTDFVSKVDEEDVFESDFASTDDEQEDEEAGEKALEEEEKRARRAARAKPLKLPIAPQLKVSFAVPLAGEGESSTSQPRLKHRRVSLGAAVDAETGQVLETITRQSTREATRLNTREVRSRIKDAESKKVSTTPKKPKEKKRRMTQADLITIALDLEEENTKSHREYLAVEEERRKKARVLKPATFGPKIRWRSRGQDATVTVYEDAPQPAYVPRAPWPIPFGNTPGQPGAPYPYPLPVSSQPGQTAGNQTTPRPYPVSSYALPYASTTATASTSKPGSGMPPPSTSANATSTTSIIPIQATPNPSETNKAPETNGVSDTATPTTNGSSTTPASNTGVSTTTTSAIQPAITPATPSNAAASSTTGIAQGNATTSAPNTTTVSNAATASTTPGTPSNAASSQSAVPATPHPYSPYYPYSYYAPPAGQTPYPPYGSYYPYAPSTHYGQQQQQQQQQPQRPHLQLQPPPQIARKAIEKQTKNFVEVLLDEEKAKEKPTWRQTMDSLFGTHADWDNVRVYHGKNRPIARQEQTCPITGTKAKYRDPRSGVPYANVGAFRILTRLLAHEYVWSPAGAGQGVFVGHEKQRGAYGVPDRWGQAIAGVPADWRTTESELKKEEKPKDKAKDKGKEKEYRVGERRSSRIVGTISEVAAKSSDTVPMDVDEPLAQ
ncbi:hypothetical protein M422DRAFT_779135 [Sphaerobolus stellatus SS14]|uniref:Vps72/YL1 C-terminal domain-containing protein n=1 Tax=Sphaerobolus stellatus (strain SS14) TaxID=990650 RepID=A0A0C9UQL1_SPHS4|nr:hypothetical protein M422DRAFT_779135 [Sphaerobolus stellatus SS14]